MFIFIWYCQSSAHIEMPDIYSVRFSCLRKEDDLLVRVGPMLERVDDWEAYLGEGIPESVLKLIRHHGRTGRPVGSEDFIRTLERKTGRSLRKRKPGPPPVDK